jgi:hypothetical protein
MTSYRPITTILFSLSLVTGIVAPAAGQLTPFPVSVGVASESFRFQNAEATGLRSVTLLTSPFHVAVPVAAGMRLEVGGSFARGSLSRRDGSTARLQGLTDTQMRLRLPVNGDFLTLNGIAILPTGVGTSSAEEVEVAGIIASDLLPFAITNWGTGGGGGFSATLAHSFGAVAAGVGASYLTYRQFDPLQDGQFAAYRPGDQIGGQLAFNASVGTAGKASLQFALLHQRDDQLAEANLFRAGNRFQGMGSYAFRAGRMSSGVVYAGGGRRERGGALLEIVRDSPSQDLGLVGAGFRFPMTRTSVLVPTAEGRIFRTGDGAGQGYLTGLGVALESVVGGVQVVPRARGRIGRVLVREGLESDLVGLELGASVNLGPRR